MLRYFSFLQSSSLLDLNYFRKKKYKKIKSRKTTVLNLSHTDSTSAIAGVSLSPTRQQNKLCIVLFKNSSGYDLINLRPNDSGTFIYYLCFVCQ